MLREENDDFFTRNNDLMHRNGQLSADVEARSEEIEQQKQKLNLMFDDTEGQNDLTMRLTEMLKTKAEEYNQCINRIDKMLAKLNGERAKRVANQQQRNASIISLVQLFQDEEERKLMIRMAEMQKKLVRREADEIEKMPDWKARVLGISREDAM